MRIKFIGLLAATMVLGCAPSERNTGGPTGPTSTARPDAAAAVPPLEPPPTSPSGPDAAATTGPTPGDAAAPPASPDAKPPSPPAAVCPPGLRGPTPAEIKSVDDRLKAAPDTPAGTNQGNNFAYGNAAKLNGRLSAMYGLTGDVYYVDQLLRFADYMLSQRNDHAAAPRTIWTGAAEPCWPNKATTDPDAAYCGTENGLVLDHIAGAAKVIAAHKEIWDRPVAGGDSHGYGATYIARARTYLKEVNRTLDGFLVPRYVQPARSNRLFFPTDPGYAALGPRYASAQGHSVPWNQQDMITSALSTVADTLMLLGEEPARVAANDAITRAAIDWFVGELSGAQYMANGVTVYKWGYSPGDLRHIENLAHASADINMLYKAYRRGRFGLAATALLPMANTFLEVIAKPGGTYAANVDGTGARASVSDSWMNYEDFRPGIVAVLHPTVTAIDGSTDLATAVAMLSLRQRLCR